MLDDFKLPYRVAMMLRARGKASFIYSFPANSKVLDIGCGNRSPKRFKMLRPDLYYIGLDIDDYNQDAPQSFADLYIITSAEKFAAEIRRFDDQVDGVISAHNLEHCADPDAVLTAMLGSLRPGGSIYLSFPCEESLKFPSRRGCLNFYDDPSHLNLLNWEHVLSRIQAAGFQIQFSRRRYRPIFPRLLGLIFEPLAWATGKQVPFGATWALYGFESVVWATRPHEPIHRQIPTNE